MKIIHSLASTLTALAAAFSSEVNLATAFSPSQSGFAAVHTDSTRTPNRSKTSLDLSPAIMVRGGAAAAGDVVLKSFYGDALGFFGGIRMPASFLAGSALAAIFTLKGAANSLSSDGQLSILERRVIKFYHLASSLAFLLSLNTIILATVAYTSVLHGRFDSMAETAYLMMKREFEYEFVSVRWSFLTSMFCFLGMITSRILIEFNLLKEDAQNGKTTRDVAVLVVCSVGALAAHLMSYVNHNLWCWKSLIGMTFSLAKMVFNRTIVERQPMQIISVVCTFVSMYYVGKLTLQDVKGSNGKDAKKSN